MEVWGIVGESSLDQRPEVGCYNCFSDVKYFHVSITYLYWQYTKRYRDEGINSEDFENLALPLFITHKTTIN
jgi:hypothetical protein